MGARRQANRLVNLYHRANKSVRAYLETVYIEDLPEDERAALRAYVQWNLTRHREAENLLIGADDLRQGEMRRVREQAERFWRDNT